MKRKSGNISHILKAFFVDTRQSMKRRIATERQHLLTNPECTKTYTDDSFRIIGQARSSFHFNVLESVYIKIQNPVLCKQKDFIFSLGIFK